MLPLRNQVTSRSSGFLQLDFLTAIKPLCNQTKAATLFNQFIGLSELERIHLILK
jgi:hypothetical protein